MRKWYGLFILSALSVTVMLILRIPKAMDGAVDEAVKQQMPFMHDYNVCDITLQNHKYKEAADCFGEMLTKYDRSDVRYNYAVALANSRDYGKAKKELEYIIDNEKNAPQIVEQSKKLDSQIDDMLKELRLKTEKYSDIKENNLDVGDYVSDLKSVTLWKNPTNITVYITEDPKKELYKQAFTLWNGALEGTIYFKFVDDVNANIACAFVNRIQGDEGGLTDWYYTEENGKKYFKNAVIQVARLHPKFDKELTDKQLFTVILHEIGHALGISDHSPFKGDIMYFSTDSFLNEKGVISQRDINTIKKLYKK